MKKPIRLYRLNDEINDLDIFSLNRFQLEKYEDRATKIYNGYFLTLAELEQFAKECFEEGWGYGDVGIIDSSRGFSDFWQQEKAELLGKSE